MAWQDDYRLLQEHEVPQRADDFVCRGDRRRAGIAVAIACSLAGALLLGPSLAPVHIWGWHGIEAIAYPAGLFMALLAWLAWRVWRAHLAPTNWLLRAGIDGLYLRYRSPLNGNYPGEPVAVFLPRRLIRHIAAAGDDRETGNSDSQRGIEPVPALDIHLRTTDLGPLRQALRRERGRGAPTHFGKGGVFPHFPVRVVAGEIIRIDWRTPQFAATPHHDVAADVLSRQSLRLVATGAPGTVVAPGTDVAPAATGTIATGDANAFVDRLQG